MLYKSLQTSNLENQVESVDVNNVINYNISALVDFETEIIDVSNKAEFLIIPSEIVGSGTLKYYQSLDKINWNQVTKDNNTTNVEFSISDDTIHTLKDFRVVGGYRKFVMDAGSISGGTITIKFDN